ncbi:hypothetical protein QJS04_geneDACA003636 [Acorus gramineus]|uniref:KHG/KDPG aldolase n=1 Tax=Acorus gramineus TaxID=55184 RepID=A0AAV9BR46_ACOGR|nr:hypothetical protein QJS04_geneDACA003636 [Acorus gramineus]
MATVGFTTLSPRPPIRNPRQSRLISSCHARRSSPSPVQTLAEIERSGVIACLRADSGDVALEAAHAALRAGISVLEVVMSTPGVFEVIRKLIHDHPTSIIGAGTILNAKDARKVAQAGAQFFMSPATIKVLSACNAGARIVKVYPVSSLGGAKYISALKKPFSHIPMVASQGITIDSIGTYIDGGASAVVLSDAIFDKQAMRQMNFDVIFKLAAMAAVQGRKAAERSALGEEIATLDKNLTDYWPAHGS